MINLHRTNSTNPDFVSLVKLLDADLAVKDGELHGFYDQYNHIDKINQVIVAYENGQAIACGGIKPFDGRSMEVKRMFTLPDHRGRGIASLILLALEHWALELSAERCLLETGKNQPDAIALYNKRGYHTIPNYGQYAGVEYSVCFEKMLEEVSSMQ